MNDIKFWNTTFSGTSQNVNNIINSMVLNCDGGKKSVVIDYYNIIFSSSNFQEISLADFIPYLNDEECAEIFSILCNKRTPELASLMYRFVILFSNYSRNKNVALFDTTSWNMYSLLQNSTDDIMLNNFLQDNFDRLAILENEVVMIIKNIGSPRCDLSNTIEEGKILLIKNKRLNREILRDEILEILLDCLSCYLSPCDTEFFIIGFAYDTEKIITEFLNERSFNKTIIIKDIFTFDNTTQSMLLNGARKVVFLKHTSYESCKKIADYIGKQEQFQASVSTYPRNGVFATVRDFFRGVSLRNDSAFVQAIDRSNTGFSVSKVEKFRLRPEEIMQLPDNKCIIVDTNSHTYSITEV